MARYANILETIGNTPLVRLNKLAPAGVNVYVKVESFNPMGSVKDRMARAVIEQAERSGALKPGQTVIEATSGNTGIGLAMVCAQKGYPLVVTMAENFSVERRKMLRFLGARVVLTPASEKGTGMLAKAVELAERTAGSFVASSRMKPTRTYTPARPRRRFLRTLPTSRSTTGSPASVPAARSRASHARSERRARRRRSSPPSPTMLRCSAAASPSRATRTAPSRGAIRVFVRT